MYVYISYTHIYICIIHTYILIIIYMNRSHEGRAIYRSQIHMKCPRSGNMKCPPQYIHTHTHTHTHTYLCIYYICTCICICMCTCTCICLCLYIYIYIYIYIYLYIYIVTGPCSTGQEKWSALLSQAYNRLLLSWQCHLHTHTHTHKPNTYIHTCIYIYSQPPCWQQL